jgi:hypothetical protein
MDQRKSLSVISQNKHHQAKPWMYLQGSHWGSRHHIRRYRVAAMERCKDVSLMEWSRTQIV